MKLLRSAGSDERKMRLVFTWEQKERICGSINRHTRLLHSGEPVDGQLLQLMIYDNSRLVQLLINLPPLAGSQRRSTVEFKLDWSLRDRILVNTARNNLFIKESANKPFKAKAFKDDLIEENKRLVSALQNLKVRGHKTKQSKQNGKGETLLRNLRLMHSQWENFHWSISSVPFPLIDLNRLVLIAVFSWSPPKTANLIMKLNGDSTSQNRHADAPIRQTDSPRPPTQHKFANFKKFTKSIRGVFRIQFWIA